MLIGIALDNVDNPPQESLDRVAALHARWSVPSGRPTRAMVAAPLIRKHTAALVDEISQTLRTDYAITRSRKTTGLARASRDSSNA